MFIIFDLFLFRRNSYKKINEQKTDGEKQWESIAK